MQFLIIFFRVAFRGKVEALKDSAKKSAAEADKAKEITKQQTSLAKASVGNFPYFHCGSIHN